MILDTLKNSELYESIHPQFKQAFDFLHKTDLVALPLGKHELDGSDLYVNVVEINGNSVEEARMESHKRYIDIQVPISAPETMGWMPVDKLKVVTEPYNTEKDVAFFADKTPNLIHVDTFSFAIFFPSDGHQPGIAECVVKKLIIKVLV